MRKYYLFVFEVIVLASNFKVNCKQIDSKCQLHSDSGQLTKDLIALYRPEGYVATANNMEKYIINICGEVSCGAKNVVACKIDRNGISTTFADTWNISKHLIHYNQGKKVGQISLECNYTLQEPRLDVLSAVGKKGIKLKFQSSFLCFSEPTKCKIKNLDRTSVDISSLFRDENWKVKNNISDDQIYLNLCGPMNPISKYPGCTENGAQVCLLTNTEGISRNLGSSSSALSSNSLNRFSLSFSGGYICKANKDTVTNIEFTCSFVEEGPILVSKADCEYVIHWRTPAICLHYISESKNCLINNDLFNNPDYQITSIYQEKKLPNNNVIKYNICDNLNASCHGERTGVSFCLVQNKNEIILGRLDKSVHFRDGQLTMHMTGEKCSLSKIHNVFVTFHCDYTKRKTPLFSFSDDSCTTNVTIFTNQVCWEPNPEEVKCVTETNKSGKYFNLTGLQLKDRNYEVEDHKNNVTYILNMCQPVVFNAMAFCKSAMCLRNNNESDITRRFLELGSTIKINDGNDILSIEMAGAICREQGGKAVHTVLLKFICADKNLITFKSSNHCTHIFIWETKYACPSQNNTYLDNMSHREIIEEIIPLKEKSKITNNAENAAKNNLIVKDFNSENLEAKDARIKPSIRVNKNDELVQTEPIIKSDVISLFVPIQVSNTTGLYINNCTLANYNVPGSNYSLFLLPRNVNISSSNGQRYSVNLCSSQGKVTNISLDYSNRLVEIHLQELSQLNDNSFYNSAIFLKCSPNIYYPPSVIKETIYSVELEWRNKAACALLKSDDSDKVTLKTTSSNPFDEVTSETKSAGLL